MIYLIRHGESEWNKQRIFNGLTDVELTANGWQQARKMREKLQKYCISLCFCSPLKRAIQTGEIVYGRGLRFDERLKEIDCGAFEGTKETPEQMQLFWKAIQTGENGTERYDRFLKRNFEFCDEIIKNNRDQNILIITHAANARAIDFYLKGKPRDYDLTKAVGARQEILAFDL